MRRITILTLLLRVAGVIAALVLLGIVLKLIGEILTPVLPATLLLSLRSGWDQLYTAISPAIGPIGALTILILILWVIFGRR